MASESGLFTYEASNPLFRFSHRRRLTSVRDRASPKAGETILDFGGGDGHVVANLAMLAPDTEFVILEPFRTPEIALARDLANVRWVKSQSDVNGERFDKILCVDVMEHLPDPVLAETLHFFREHLKPDGTCIISVPLEIGPPAIFKNAIRVASRRAHPATAFSTVLRSAMRRTDTIERPTDGQILQGHIGFDAFRLLEKVVGETGFRLERQYTSPFAHLPWFLNNQIGFVLKAPPSR